MQVPPEIIFTNVERTDSLTELVDRRVKKLERFNDHIISCHVVVEKRQEAVASGTEFRVRASARVPPKHELVGKYRNGPEDHPIAPEQAVTRAFDALERQLRELTQRQRGEAGHGADKERARAGM